MAVVGIHAQLVDDLVAVFALHLDIDQGVVQWRAVIPYEGAGLTQRLGRSKNIRADHLVQKPGELPVCQRDAVQCLKLLPEVFL